MFNKWVKHPSISNSPTDTLIHLYRDIGIYIWMDTHFTTGGGGLLFVMDVLLFFFKIGGLLVLSLLDDDRLLGSLCSMSCTRLLMYCASGQCLATLCNNAVVDDVLNRPRARRRKPWLKQASTAAHKAVTEPDSSWTNFRVTASSITCFTSFLTEAISRSL